MSSKAKRKPGPSKPPQIKLVKVLVQPIFVIDHGTYAQELEHPPVAIPANEWPTYSSERFPRELKAFQAELANQETKR